MRFDSETRLLVVASHPDDEVLGCGGTLARAVDHGVEAAVMFLGEGISSRFTIEEYDSPEFAEQTKRRKAGAERALEILGITNVRYSERLCAQFDTYPMLSIVKEIEEQLEAFRPTMLFTHNPSEVNIDHRITFEAVEIACRPTRDFIPRAIYAFEIVCSGGWKFVPTFKPNVFVDVSQYWEKKIAAWHAYEGEARPFPFPRSDEGLETLARYRGMNAGLEMAEAFFLARQAY
jgi:LmbE family N-acetylglucosaminyl deacetylase